MQYVITLNRIGKKFRRYHTARPNTIKEWVTKRFMRFGPSELFWALRDVSLALRAETMLGIIGTNGSGKSTLLRLLGGVLRPDEGSMKVKGRMGALIELGAGFHPDLSGRENVYIYGVLAGLTRSEVSSRFDSIVSFAEMERFIDNPYRTYSSGMQMRLAFSAAMHTEPEIMLIDEVLAVGDIAFQEKCLNRIGELRKSGCAMVLVSHDVEKVREICDEAAWLRSGRLVMQGDKKEVIDSYISSTSGQIHHRTPSSASSCITPSGFELRLNENRFGSLEMEILNVRVLDSYCTPVAEVESGKPFRVEIEYLAPNPVVSPIFGVILSDEVHMDCCDVNTAASGFKLPSLHGRGKVHLILDRVDLTEGTYYVDAGVYEESWQYSYDFHWHVYPFTVRASGNRKGILSPPHKWQLVENEADGPENSASQSHSLYSKSVGRG